MISTKLGRYLVAATAIVFGLLEYFTLPYLYAYESVLILLTFVAILVTPFFFMGLGFILLKNEWTRMMISYLGILLGCFAAAFWFQHSVLMALFALCIACLSLVTLWCVGNS